MAACPTCHQPATTRDGFDRPGVHEGYFWVVEVYGEAVRRQKSGRSGPDRVLPSYRRQVDSDPGEAEGDVLTCPRLDIQHGELEIPHGALLSHSNHLNHSRSERRPPSDPGSSQAC